MSNTGVFILGGTQTDFARNWAREGWGIYAQTREWSFNARSFTADDEVNPVVEGRVRRNDCGQISDGAASAWATRSARAACA